MYTVHCKPFQLQYFHSTGKETQRVIYPPPSPSQAAVESKPQAILSFALRSRRQLTDQQTGDLDLSRISWRVSLKLWDLEAEEGWREMRPARPAHSLPYTGGRQTLPHMPSQHLYLPSHWPSLWQMLGGLSIRHFP